ncbi:hypothetical protein C8Q70DRAFT_1038487 [Cubamyces menziesii]|nr:hypothetical protein C8Q70DRAFT_1038487 [Cubamyces menziesii]
MRPIRSQTTQMPNGALRCLTGGALGDQSRSECKSGRSCQRPASEWQPVHSDSAEADHNTRIYALLYGRLSFPQAITTRLSALSDDSTPRITVWCMPRVSPRYHSAHYIVQETMRRSSRSTRLARQGRPPGDVVAAMGSCSRGCRSRLPPRGRHRQRVLVQRLRINGVLRNTWVARWGMCTLSSAAGRLAERRRRPVPWTISDASMWKITTESKHARATQDDSDGCQKDR